MKTRLTYFEFKTVESDEHLRNRMEHIDCDKHFPFDEGWSLVRSGLSQVTMRRRIAIPEENFPLETYPERNEG